MAQTITGTNLTWLRTERVGCSQHLTPCQDHLRTLPDHGHDRSAREVLHQALEEGLARQVLGGQSGARTGNTGGTSSCRGNRKRCSWHCGRMLDSRLGLQIHVCTYCCNMYGRLSVCWTNQDAYGQRLPSIDSGSCASHLFTAITNEPFVTS